MSRSGYSYDCDYLGLWRGAVSKAIRGNRGQSFLKEMLTALDALPEKKLITGDFKTNTGEVCALGAVGLKRGIDLTEINPEDRGPVGKLFGIAPAMAAEIMYENDEGSVARGIETPEDRFQRIRAWVVKNISEREEPTVAETTKV